MIGTFLFIYSIHLYLKMYYSEFIVHVSGSLEPKTTHTLEAKGDPQISMRRAGERPHSRPSVDKEAIFAIFVEPRCCENRDFWNSFMLSNL